MPAVLAAAKSSLAVAHEQAQTVAYANEGGLRVSQGVTYKRVLVLEFGPRAVAAVRGLNLLCGGSVACLRAQRWLIASVSTASRGQPSLWRRSCLMMSGRSCSRTWCAISVWLDNFGNCLCR